MQKIIFAILVGLLPVLVKAQVSVNVQLPAAGFVQKEQLWNLVLVNNNTDAADLSIRLNVQDAHSGQVLLSATTGSFLVSKGVKLLKTEDVQPVAYSYAAPDFSGTYLPMGAYIACYQVINNASRKDAPVAQECTRINIDPLSPPQLTSPLNKSELTNPYPQFTWMPPTPLDMFNNLTYDLLITEVLQGQSATQAIQYNTPVYTKSNLSQSYENYATGFTKLDTGKLYAWQVVARNGLNYAAKTEVWTFKIAPPSWVKQLIEQTPFIKMKQDNPERGIAPNGILKLSYMNETGDTLVKVRITDPSASQQQETVFDIKVSSGENLVQHDLQKMLHPQEGKTYEACIINSRNEKWKIFFEVKEYKEKKQQVTNSNTQY